MKNWMCRVHIVIVLFFNEVFKRDKEKVLVVAHRHKNIGTNIKADTKGG